MFSPQTPMRLHGCNGKTKKDSEGDRRRVVLLTWMLQPFTPEMAADLAVKSQLFRSDGTPRPEMLRCTLNIKVPLQRMLIAAAPDIDPSVIVDAVDVGTQLSCSADREGPVFTAYFSAEFDYPTAEQLLWLFHKVTEQVFVTFEPAQGDMLARQGTTTPRLRGRKGSQPALTEEPADAEPGNGDDEGPGQTDDDE